MAMGRKARERQGEFWVATQLLPGTPRHVFYEKLNGILADGDFDRFVEDLCEPYYAETLGRESIPPGVYFRMTLIGYFEGIDSQRGIAWRCADSRSLAAFLGYSPKEATPDHSSLSRIRGRLPLKVHEQVFAFVLALAEQRKLLKGKTVAVDSTTLEANAAMKSIVRKDTGEDYHDYLVRLMREEGLVGEREEPNDEEVRRFDKRRKKKVSNEEWESPTDPDARITKMKDGRTHLAYKAEHVVDVETEFVLAARVDHADVGDPDTFLESVGEAQRNLHAIDAEQRIEEGVADKGYHKNGLLADCADAGLRTYIPERETGKRRWTDKPPEQEAAFRANRRRVRGERGRRLQRQRSELVERSFAHVCETGGARRTWLRGLERVRKRYLIQVAAHNLGLIMRKLFGFGKPRCLQGAGGLAALAALAYLAILHRVDRLNHLQRVITRSQPSPAQPAKTRRLAPAAA